MKELNKDELNYYYNELNYSQKELAIVIGVGVSKVIKILKKNGIVKDSTKHTEKIKQIKLERYGDCNYNNRDKAGKTCLERYGVDNPFKDTERIKASYLKKFGVTHPMKNDEIKERGKSHHDYKSSIEKGRKTYLERTGYDNPSHNPQCIRKGIETKIKNGDYDSPDTSKLEDKMYKFLCRKFNTVVRKYRDSRYARNSGYQFEGDFYIPEEDLFIELNAHPTHYIHPFDENNKKDVELREKLKASTKKWDKAIYSSWCERDVEKLSIARSNNLNYILIYPKDTIYNNQQYNKGKYKNLISYLIKGLNS